MVAFFLTLLLSHALHVTSDITPCYYQNGTDVTTYFPDNKSYQPCNASAQASMCCRINLGDDDAKDHCRADGLCDSPNRVFLWRESCTDPTWKSPHCQKLCVDYDGEDPWGGSVAGVNSVITQCDDGSYCCGIATNGSSCCTEGRGVWMVDGKETSVNPNSTDSASSTSTQSTPLPAAAVESASPTTTSAPKTSSSKSNTGAIAGGVVGGVAGLALIAGALYWLLRPRPLEHKESGTSRRGQPLQEMETDEKRFIQEMPHATLPHEADSLARTELDSETRQIWKKP